MTPMTGLNPYSTGSGFLLIRQFNHKELQLCLNPYSTGSGFLLTSQEMARDKAKESLNPYSTGSGFLLYYVTIISEVKGVLILILLEVGFC